MFNLFNRKPANYKNVDATEFANLKDQPNHVVIDVRSPQEVADGKVPGSKMINMFDADFSQKLQKLDKSKTYLVYCRSGNRSSRACSIMADMGFENLYNLSGGIGAWNRLKSHA